MFIRFKSHHYDVRDKQKHGQVKKNEDEDLALMLLDRDLYVTFNFLLPSLNINKKETTCIYGQ